MKLPRHLRLTVFSLGALILIVCGLIGLVIVNPAMLKRVIETRLSELIGGDVAIEEMEWSDGWSIDLVGVTIRDSERAGPAGELIDIKRMTVDWFRQGAGVRVRRVRVHDGVVRLIEESPWRLTLEALRPDRAGGPGGRGGAGADVSAMEIPDVQIDHLRLESGYLDGDRVVLVGSGAFMGLVSRLPGDQDAAVFTLRQGEGGAAIAGEVWPGMGRLHAVATGISLGQQSQQLVPFRWLRSEAQALGLEGELGDIDITLERGAPVQLSLWLESLAISLDPAVFGGVSDDSFWKVYQGGRVLPEHVPPRLFVDSGRLAFDGDTLHIQGLEGHIDAGEEFADAVRVPYHVDLTIRDLPDIEAVASLEDVEEALGKAPFELDVTAHDVRFDHGSRAVVPVDAARILQLFQVDQCDIDMAMVLMRKEHGGPATFSGELGIENGRGAYARFPYPLTDLHAEIIMVPSDILVRHLSARGAGTSHVSITGRVEPIDGRDLAVRVQAWDVPLDATLLGAVPPRAEATLRDVFSAQNVTLPAGGGVAHQIVDLDLLIEQDQQERLTISGEIPFEHLEMTWAEFPVTLELDSGRLRWSDALYLEDGAMGPVSIRTRDGGGTGTLAAKIDVPLDSASDEGGGRIEFAVHDERVAPPLLDALMIATSGESAVLSDGHLQGVLSASGVLEIHGDEHTQSIDVAVRSGELDVTPTLEALVGTSLRGPLGDATRLQIDGRVTLNDGALAFGPLSAQAGGAEIMLHGSLAEGGRLRVEGAGIHIGDWILDEVGEVATDEIRELWVARDPGGTMGGSLDISGGEAPQIEGLQVQRLSMRWGDGEDLELQSGALTVSPDVVAFAQPVLAITRSGLPVSEIQLDGSIRRRDGEGDLAIRSDALQLDLPILRDVIATLAGAEGDDVWRSLEPTGRVSLDASWAESGGDPWWQVGIQPDRVEASWRGHRLTYRGDGPARLRLLPGELRLDRVAGRLGDARIDVEGVIALEPLAVEFEGTYAGSLASPLIQAAAGPEWMSILDELEFQDGQTPQVTSLMVALKESPQGWSGRIAGQVALRDATMTAGLTLHGVSAILDADIGFSEGRPEVMLGVSDAACTVHGAAASDLKGRVRTVPTPEAPDRLEIGPLHGLLADGVVTVEGTAGGVQGAWSASVLLANGRLSKLFPTATGPGARPSSGEVDASLHIRGKVGAPDGVVGTGSFQVRDGYLRTLPALVALQQVMHLSSPVVGAIAFVDVEFLVAGSNALLEQVLLASGPDGQGGFSLRGNGEMNLSTMDVDVHLRPRGAWPIVRDVIGLLQDQLYEVTITGPVGDPEVGISALPGLFGRSTRN